MPETGSIVPVARVQQAILALRGCHVMLDEDLAALYSVKTKALVQAVKRNLDRFPEDFMFQLTAKETHALISQIAMSKIGRGGRWTLPYAFTEHGVAMLSSVLNSERAVEMNNLPVTDFAVSPLLPSTAGDDAPGLRICSFYVIFLLLRWLNSRA